MFLKFRLKFANFIRNNRIKIIIILIVWAIIIAINFFLGHRKPIKVLNTTYTPHEVALSNNGETVQKKFQEPIEKLIDDFVNNCNEKNYDKAYSLLSDDCKKNVFNNSTDEFKKYVDEVFPREKIYSMQSYSETDDFYIYNVKILDNILETGLTDQEYSYYEEKFAITKDLKNLKMTVGNYMGKKELKKISEDDNIKIRIEEKVMYYGKEVYKVKLTNKTDKIMVIENNFEDEEILLAVGNSTRTSKNVQKIIIYPGETQEYELVFSKFYDEENSSDKIIFNKIRLFENYSGEEENYQSEKEKAVKEYSIGTSLN